jgi:hypothetical protein
MSPEKKSKFTPRTLRVVLALLLIVILGSSAAGFIYAQKELREYAKEISRKKIDANASNSTISTLKKVKNDLGGYSDVKEKIQGLRANDVPPEFRIVNEVTKIAARNNIPISSFDFGDGATASPSTTSGTATPTTPTAPVAGSTTSNAKTISLTVNFGQVNDYKNYLQFLYDIEQNIPKMRVKSVSVSSGGSASTNTSSSSTNQTSPPASNGLNIQPITIELYIQ